MSKKKTKWGAFSAGGELLATHESLAVIRKYYPANDGYTYSQIANGGEA